MNRPGQNSEAMFQRARRSIPGGVNSPVRAFQAVGGNPLFVTKAQGCYVWDVDGNEYLDLIGSWGPAIVGHAHPQVVAAIQQAAANGASFGLSHPGEYELAEEIKSRIPSIEKIRFVSSGTEAAMSAIRLARAFTQRTKIVKFAGCYHGHADAFLIEAGSGLATQKLPDFAGVTTGAGQDTVNAPYNDAEAVERIFTEEGDSIAAIIIEPIAGNMGVVPPQAGFLEELRRLCNRWGTLLIFDEVISGFRVAPGGAQQLFGVSPDLTLLGKIIGGGMPVGAFGGRADVMKLLAPDGPVYQAGTLSGNPVAMVAGLATLQLLTSTAYQQLEAASSELQTGLERAIYSTNQTGVVQRVGSLLTLFFADRPVSDFTAAKSADHLRFGRFFCGMLERGVLLPPSGYEAWFVSLAHSSDEIEKVVRAAEETLQTMA